MIKFKDAEPAKSKEAPRKAADKAAETAATPEIMAPEGAASGARKTTAPKRGKKGAG